MEVGLCGCLVMLGVGTLNSADLPLATPFFVRSSRDHGPKGEAAAVPSHLQSQALLKLENRRSDSSSFASSWNTRGIRNLTLSALS